MRHWTAALWPLALLVVFLGTFRTTGHDSGREQTAEECPGPRASDITTLEQCLEVDPRNVEIIAGIGDLYFSSGDTHRAEMMYLRALSIDPRDGDVHLRLGELLLMRGDAAAAQAQGEAALMSQPGNLEAERLIERAIAVRRTAGTARVPAGPGPSSSGDPGLRR
jgi:tetratricopeptide (TPR) repeat protein